MTLRELWQRGRAWRTDPLLLTFLRTPPGRLARTLYEINLRDRALALAGQAFIALVPLVIVLATWLSPQDGAAIGEWLVRRFSLSGTAAQAVDQLFGRPPDETSGISALGLVILLISVNSFARTLQRTFEVAWVLPEQAPRRTPQRLASFALLMVLLIALTWLTAQVRKLPVGGALAVPVQLSLAVPCWTVIVWLILSGRIPWRRLVPGAVLAAVAQILATWSGAIWVPELIERNAQRYGVIGVAIALISWLVVLAFVLVACAATGAWAGGVDHGALHDGGRGLSRRSGLGRALDASASRPTPDQEP